MKNLRPTTIPELRRLKGIKMSDIEKVIAKQTYYNRIEWKRSPTNKEPVRKFCELFEIDEKTFKKLLKNTIKNFNY